jgi:hypothetical protein
MDVKGVRRMMTTLAKLAAKCGGGACWRAACCLLCRVPRVSRTPSFRVGPDPLVLLSYILFFFLLFFPAKQNIISMLYLQKKLC